DLDARDLGRRESLSGSGRLGSAERDFDVGTRHEPQQCRIAHGDIFTDLTASFLCADFLASLRKARNDTAAYSAHKTGDDAPSPHCRVFDGIAQHPQGTDMDVLTPLIVGRLCF